uniref:Uncharacterized protein n=1 Tax=Anguilla anguilla TaxID=7936 RepID=A0A0E9XSV9_ANGAN
MYYAVHTYFAYITLESFKSPLT